MAEPKGHDRKLGLLGADLVVVHFKVDRVKLLGAIRDQVEALMIESDYLGRAPFRWITLSLRSGLKNDIEPSYRRINAKYGDLPMTIEMDVSELQFAVEEEVRRAYLTATLRALAHAARKFGLNAARIDFELASCLTR